MIQTLTWMDDKKNAGRLKYIKMSSANKGVICSPCVVLTPLIFLSLPHPISRSVSTFSRQNSFSF